VYVQGVTVLERFGWRALLRRMQGGRDALLW
jgi:hypothetical protein